jgi:DNA-binding IclR family transcriptional regulator
MAESRGVQSIEVGGRLLKVLVDADAPIMLKDLASRANLAPAQAHAYLVSFRKQQLVEQDAETGRYRLGSFALLAWIARMRSFDPLRMVRDEISRFALETGFTVALAVWGTHGPTIIQIQEGADQLYTKTRAGTVYSLFGTATGRVFAAFQSPDIVNVCMEDEAREGQHSKRVGSVKHRPIPARELQRIRERGCATILPPPIPGVHAVSAPVFNHAGQIQLAVTIMGPSELLPASDDTSEANLLKYFANSLSNKLGYDPNIRSTK